MGTPIFVAHRQRYLQIIVLTIFLIGVFFILQFLGPVITAFLIGPTGVSPNFQNATRPSGPDIVVTNMSYPQQIKAGIVNTFNLTVNVTNGNGTGGMGNWTVNVTLYSTVSGGPAINVWNSSNYSTANSVRTLTTADIDGDGDPDVVAGIDASSGSTSLHVFNNTGGNLNINGWQNFSLNTGSSDQIYQLATGDLDSDGDNDIVLVMIGATDKVLTFNNTGGINITQWNFVNTSADNDIYGVAIGDMDSDGQLDVIVSLGNSGNRITIYNNPGNKSLNLSQWVTYNATLTNWGRAIAVGDFDNDGDPDVVSGVNTALTLFNNSGGAPPNIGSWGTSSTTLTNAISYRGLAIGDVNGDGYNDIAVGDGAKLYLFINPASSQSLNMGSWTSSSTGTVNSVNQIAIGDIDNNGYNDIVAGMGPGAGGAGQVSIYNNTGGSTTDITQWPVINVTTENNALTTAVGDIDSDGDLDVLTGLQNTGNRISIYNNTEVRSTLLTSQTLNYTNTSNILQTYFLNWTPSASYSSVLNITAVADPAQNFSETIRSNNYIIAPAFVCVPLNGTNTYLVNNTTTFCAETYLMNVSNGNAAVSVLNSSLTVDCNGATIVGNNRDGNGIGLFVNNSSVTIKGCSIANYTYGALVNLTFNVNFTNNTFFNNTYGIFLNSTNQTTIWNQTMHNNSISGLFTFNTNNTTLLNSTIRNGTFYGMRILAGVNNTIENNTVYNNTVVGILIENTNTTNLNNNTLSYSSQLAGIYINFSSSNITLRRNIIFNNLADGITLYGSPTACGWNLVENNTITNQTNNANGISMAYCPNSTISDNVISNNSYGIRMFDNNITMLVSNNRIFNNSLVGIFAGVLTGERNLTIYNNTISNNSAHGIRIIMGLNITIENNTIYNNTEVGISIENTNNTTILNNSVSYTSSKAGILLNFSSSNNTVKRNNVFTNRLDGINVSGYPSVCGWNIVENNTIYNNSGGYGVVLQLCPNSTIANNTIYNNSIGISISQNNFSTRVSYNYIYNNSIGINVSNDWNVTILNNTIRGNNGTSTSPNRTGIYVAQNAWINASSINITGNNISGQNFGLNNSNAAPNYAHNVTIYNNYFNNSLMNAQDRSAGNSTWNISKRAAINIMGKPFIAGNFWSDYVGVDRDGDFIGDTLIPHNVSENITVGGDYAPLILQTALLHSLTTEVNHTLFYNNNRGVLNVSNATFANFTLQAPNGSNVINDVNGTGWSCSLGVASYCMINSTIKRFDLNGTWWLNVSVGNVTASSINQTDSIRIDVWDNVTLNTTAVSFLEFAGTNKTFNKSINSSTNETLNYTATFVFNNVTTETYFNYSCVQANGTTPYILGNGTWNCSIVSIAPVLNASEYDAHYFNVTVNRTAFALGTFWQNISGNYNVSAAGAAATVGEKSKSVEEPLETKAPPKQSEVIKEDAKSVTVELLVGGKVEVRFGEAEKTYSSQKGIPYKFKVSAQTGRITAFINDNKLFEVDDFTYRSGKIGFRTYGTIAGFDDVRVSDIISTTAERPPAFEDHFSDSNAQNWKALTGIWEVYNGAYTQRSRVPTEQVALAGKDSWADFTYEATVALDPATTNTVAGLVFRAKDENNFYTFFFDSNNRISLRKSIGGTLFPVGESEVHTIKVLSATPQRVRLLITSAPIVVDVIPGQKAFVDVNNDGENDLAILVSKVTGAATVEMTVEKLRLEKKPAAAVEIAKPEAEAPPAEEEAKVTAKVIEKPTEPQRMPPIYLIAVLSAAAVLLFGAYSYRTYKKRAEIQEIQKKMQFGETTFEEKPPEEKEKTAEGPQEPKETPESQKQESDEENQ